MARNPHLRATETKIRSRTDALLRGLLFAPVGDPMYPTYTRKNGRQYRYYISRSESRFGAAGKTFQRIPAAEVDAPRSPKSTTVRVSPEAITAVCLLLTKNGAPVDEPSAVLGAGEAG